MNHPKPALHVVEGAQPKPSATVALDHLHAEKRRLHHEAQKLLQSIQRIEAQPTDSGARAELAALDAAERKAMQEWAAAGGAGDPPALDVASRNAIEQRLKVDDAKAATVRAAADALSRQYQGTIDRANGLGVEIHSAALDVIREEASAAASEALDAISRVRTLIGNLAPVSRLLSDEAHRLGEQHIARKGELLRWIESFPFTGGLPLRDTLGSLLDIRSTGSVWEARLRELTAGKEA